MRVSFQSMMLSAGALSLLGGCATVEDAPRGEAAYMVAPADAPGAAYALRPGDVVRISVYHEPGLSLEDAEVDAAGAVHVPLVGAVPVAGMAAPDAAKTIAGRLERYLVSPQVSLFVKKAVERRVTLDGEVRNPGLYPVEGRLTLSQAVALAGGPSRLAGLDQIVIVRRTEGVRKAARFNLGAIRKGEADDPVILPGDSVLVGLSAWKAVLGGTLVAAPAIAAGFIALDGD